MKRAPEFEQLITGAERIVIKIGSSSLTGKNGERLDPSKIDTLVDLVATLSKNGKEVLIVSSGAIAAGIAPLGLPARPKDLALQQAAASVGQGILIRNYTQSFSRYSLIASQVLLTSEDIVRRAHYKNIRSTLFKLIELGVIPIINENDSVGVQEIRFGDNDRIAALISQIVKADLLVMISDVKGLLNNPPDQLKSSDKSEKEIEVISLVENFSEIENLTVTGSGSKVGSGGMVTKIEAAKIATSGGTSTLLTNLEEVSRILLPNSSDASSKSNASSNVGVEDKSLGTLFLGAEEKIGSRDLWLAHASTPRGKLTLDPGAIAAVIERGSSLLPTGVQSFSGDFSAGESVELVDGSGKVIARGIIGFDSDEIGKLLGRSTKELSEEFGAEYGRELIHRDDLVLL
jgi:glutamate 5-kinase